MMIQQQGNHKIIFFYQVQLKHLKKNITYTVHKIHTNIFTSKIGHFKGNKLLIYIINNVMIHLTLKASVTPKNKSFKFLSPDRPFLVNISPFLDFFSCKL